MSDKYYPLGLRRDKNLIDLENRVSGLNNLLNNLGSGDNFISEDLDCIRGLKTEAVQANNLYELAGFNTELTYANGETVSTDKFLIRIKDKIENVKSITGDIPAYNGGLGLKATFVPSTYINQANINSAGNTLFNIDSSLKSEIYWENGYFYYDNTIEENFPDNYGGIFWEGYYSPEFTSGNYRNIAVETDGLLIFECDTNSNGVWNKLISVYANNRTVNATSDTVDANTITISSGDLIYVSANDYLNQNTSIVVESITGTTLQLSNNITVSNGDPIEFCKQLGNTVTTSVARFPIDEPGRMFKIRVSYWYPNTAGSLDHKTARFYVSTGGLPFWYLYDTLPSNSYSNLEIRSLLDNAITPTQKTLGGNTSAEYNNFYSQNIFNNSYTPKSSLAQIITEGPASIAMYANTRVLYCNLTSYSIEPGNYIVPTSNIGLIIYPNTQVKSSLNGYENRYKLSTNIFQTTGSRTVNFIDHKGLIGWYYANVVGSNVTISSTTGLQNNFIVITEATSNTDFIRITSIANTTQFSVSSNLVYSNGVSLNNNSIIYVYADRGLIDFSKDVFCSGVFGALTIANSAAGSNVINVSNTTGIVNGQVVQYAGYISNNATVTNVNANGEIQLSGTGTVLQTIYSGATITIAPAGTTINKEPCVIPLNNAPPFIGSVDGLQTYNGRGIKPAASVSGQFKVETYNLKLSVNTADITATSGTLYYNKKVKLNNNSYYILGSNT